MTAVDVFLVDELHQAEADIRRSAKFLPMYEARGGSGTVYQQAERFRRRLDRIERGAVSDVLDEWRKVSNTVNTELRRITDLLEAAPDDPASLERARDRLTAARDRLTATVGRYAEQVGSTVVVRQGEAATLAQNANSALEAAQLPAGASPQRLDAGQVEQLLGQLRSGPFQATIAGLGPEFAAHLQQELIDGMAQGRSPREVARRIDRSAAMPRWRGLTIARTETLRAYREVSRRQMEANRDVVAGWTWLSQADVTTCAFCWSQHGQQFATSDTMATHPNCFPAGTEVSGPPVDGATSRWLDGELVDVRTAGGRDLAVTPNHPILTSQGWVAAGELRQGHHLICDGLGERPSAAIYPHDQHGPALVEDVAITLGCAAAVRSVAMPTAPEDFHGDGVGSEVHVVRTHGLLRDRRHVAIGQPSSQELLCGRHAELSRLTSLGASALALPRVDVAASGRVGVLREPSMLIGSLAGRGDAVGLGSSALLDAGLVEDTSDDVSADSVPRRESLDRYAGPVVVDQVIEVRRRPWSGHVYNLETRDGWYIANGILVHNCKCTQVPVTRTWQELGFEGIEEPKILQVDNGPELFARQPAHVQRQVLGPAKHQAYQDGQLTLSDLAGFRDDPDWGRVGFERSLRDVLGASA